MRSLHLPEPLVLGCCASPIIVDVQGNLTNEQGGVNFDLNNDGIAEHVSWTAADSDDAFLVLDRNGNNTIDSGVELFGNLSPQPVSEKPNGFASLAEFDKPENGGNNDGLIDSHDAIFSSLLLWQDTDHNGIAEPSELHTLASLHVVSFSLYYRETPFQDLNGNWFRYKARVNIDDLNHLLLGRSAWDVFLVTKK